MGDRVSKLNTSSYSTMELDNVLGGLSDDASMRQVIREVKRRYIRTAVLRRHLVRAE